MSKLYADRDPIELGEFYTQHVQAMTSEGLHDKHEIAEELGYRDKLIADLESQLAQREWISVSERLPEESTNVCGYSEEYGWISWVYYWDEGFWDEGERPVRVDYWMDIRPPAPPKEADND